MTRRVLDVSQLPDTPADSRSLLWWGNLLTMVIEGTMFAMVLSTYLYLRTANIDWPPATVQPPALFLPTLNLAIIVFMMVPALLIDFAAKRAAVAAALMGFVICIVAGIAALVIRWGMIVPTLGYKWSSHAYGSVVWTILGLHTFHLLAATCETALLLVYALIHESGKKQLLDFRCLAVYWYFVVITWIPFYFVIYVVPHVARKSS